MTLFSNAGSCVDMVLSTRVRLARNLAEYPFPPRMSAEDAQSVVGRVTEALKKSPVVNEAFTIADMNIMSRNEALFMVERHLISLEFANGRPTPRALLLAKDEGAAIMINEEDHLRIQVMGEGLCIEKCLSDAVRLEGFLSESIPYAFSEKLGFLTSCPTNLGTGLRASVMLHLPMMSRSGEMAAVLSSLSKSGFAVRGIYGEGFRAEGDLYQISNQETMGFTEEELCTRLEGVIGKIIRRERALRDIECKKPETIDALWRSSGVLTNAYRMSFGEAAALLSDLKLALERKLVRGTTHQKLYKLLCTLGPAGITRLSGAENPHERDVKRAEHLRNQLKLSPVPVKLGG